MLTLLARRRTRVTFGHRNSPSVAPGMIRWNHRLISYTMNNEHALNLIDGSSHSLKTMCLSSCHSTVIRPHTSGHLYQGYICGPLDIDVAIPLLNISCILLSQSLTAYHNSMNNFSASCSAQPGSPVIMYFVRPDVPSPVPQSGPAAFIDQENRAPSWDNRRLMKLTAVTSTMYTFEAKLHRKGVCLSIVHRSPDSINKLTATCDILEENTDGEHRYSIFHVFYLIYWFI